MFFVFLRIKKDVVMRRFLIGIVVILLTMDSSAWAQDYSNADITNPLYDGDFDDFDKYPIEGATVTIGNHEVKSDANGQFRISLSFEGQRKSHCLSISKNRYQDFSREDESLNKDLRYLLHH